MNSRERRLAIAFGAVLGVGALVYLGSNLFSLLGGSHVQLEARLAGLKARNDALVQAIKWKARSLPPDRDAAGRPSAAKPTLEYEAWLRTRAGKAGFEDVQIEPERRGTNRRSGGAFVPVRMKITGHARLEQVRGFLHEFYCTDLLHRIVSIRFRSDESGSDPVLGVVIVVEGLSLSYGDTSSIDDEKRKLVVDKPLKEHAANPFAIYNPTLVLVGPKSVDRGEVLKLLASVRNARKSFKPTFALGGTPPEGLTIDKATGAISWKPPAQLAAGRHELVVLAKRDSDDDDPLKSTDNVTLRDPKPYEPPATPNRKPRIRPLEDVAVQAGLPVKFTVNASDPEGGKLSYRLPDGAPEGATIDAASGEFDWTPESPGEFPVAVEVSDDGSPAQTASTTVTINVAIDVAQFTRLVASIIRDDVPQAWLYDRLQNRRIILKAGTRLQYAGLDAVVLEIADRSVLFRLGERTQRLKIGDSLQDLKAATQDLKAATK